MRVRRASRLAGGLAMAATAVGVAALFSAGGGCELAVGENVPFFTCLPDAADTCPPGSVCVPATHQCISRSGTCTPGAAKACSEGLRCDAQTLRCVSAPGGLDATLDADATPGPQPDSMPDSSDAMVLDVREGDTQTADAPDVNIPDVTSEVVTCPNIGCSCSGQAVCEGGICAQELTLTTPLYAVVGKTNICTASCCTSADCPSDFVCFGTGRGGNYCVSPTWIGRNGALGTGHGGASCTGAGNCRSGLCSMGQCADTCCSTTQEAAECASGTVCRFAAFPGNGFDTHVTAWCGSAVGSTAAGGLCASDRTCQSGKCNVGSCEAVCRNSSDCGTGLACSYGLAPATLPTNQDIIEGCTPSGTTANGGNCTANADCQSAFCDGKHCTDACVTDADCKGGLHCTVVVVTVQGSYSVLACQ